MMKAAWTVALLGPLCALAAGVAVGGFLNHGH